jgi:CBS domain-containing protein
MKVSKIMTKEVICLRPDDTIAEVVKIFAENKIGGAPVVDENGALVGILTDADLFRNLRLKYKEYNISFPMTIGEGMPSVDFKTKVKTQDLKKAFKAMAETKVSEVMKTNVLTISPDDIVEVVVPLIVDKKINRLPVVKDGKLVGLVSRGDIIRAILMD